MPTLRAFPSFIDGYYGSPKRISQTPREYPFRGNGDTTTCWYDATYLVISGKFTPTAAGTVDPENAGFYLLAESKPEIFQGDLATFVRRYGNIPATQTSYSDLVINLPAFPTNLYSGAYSDSTSATATANIWSAFITPSAISTRFITGGTFTITYKTSTTAALNWNDSGATIAAAINALADLVTDATTVSVTNNISTTHALQITRATGSGDMQNLSMNSGSLTPTAVQTPTKTTSFANFYVAPSTITLTYAAHGLLTGDDIRWSATGSDAGTVIEITKLDADNFTIPVASAQAVPDPDYYRKFLRTYTPGTARVRLQLVQSFYLPGVTVGITTPADIPVPTVAINDTQLLALVIASATGWQTYDADPLARWPTDDSAIYAQTLKKINVDDL